MCDFFSGEINAMDSRDRTHSELSLESRAAPARTYRTDGDQALPLSFMQQRLWLSHRVNPSVAHNITACLRFLGRLDRRALRAALDRIVARHEVLRTKFRSIEGELAQVIEPASIGFTLTEHKVEADWAVEQISYQNALEPFDLSQGPLIRGHLLQVSEQDHVLLIVQHRIISDSWSIGVLMRELITLYRAFALGQADCLPPLSLQYRDFANWQREKVTAEVLNDHLRFWVQNLSDAPESTQLPTDRSRRPAPSYVSDRVQISLSAELTERLKKLAQREDVTLFVTLLSGWAVLLGRWSGQEEVVIGSCVPNRLCPEMEPLIGAFENTAALRLRLQKDRTVEQFLKHAQKTVLEAHAHQAVPFEQVVEALNAVRRRSPIFQVLMVLNNTPWSAIASGGQQLPELKLSEFVFENARTQLDLSLSLSEREGRLTGTLEYASDLFERETIERMAASWEALLEGMAADIQLPISRLPILPESERHRIIESFNATRVAYPRKLIHELFEEQVLRTPDAIAVVYDQQSLTYDELNGRANQLARYLRYKGVGSNQLVAVCVVRGLEMVVALLGILKAGGAYVPLDPNYPIERLHYMLEDAAPRAILTQEPLRGRFPNTAVEVISLDNEWSEIVQQLPGNLDSRLVGVHSHHLAYVIYTSGSTGKPKGVAIEHRNTVNLICWARSAVTHPKAFCQTLHSTSLNFDLSVYECFVPLSMGGSVRVVENALALLKSPVEVTLINTVPSAMEGILGSGNIPGATRVVNLAGEVLRKELVDRIFSCSQVERVCNLYGPSETTTYSSCISMRRESGFVGSIGRPIANTQIYILDECSQVVPIGVAGEIYIGGAGVARGYLNRPELTVQRFVADPFSADPLARLYKTGDLGCWRSDGAIEYLGRNDHQVKIRGFRIELGEIEAQLMRHAQVKETVVIAREDVTREKQLVAYVTRRDQKCGPSVEELRTHVKAVLPEYMVPSAFVILESLPLTPNGKLDRRKLPPPELGGYVSRHYEAPQGEVEEILAEVWQGLLRLDQVGRQDNFFELGGHSLLIVQMMERLRQSGLSADVGRVLESPTLAELARVLTSERVGQFEVPPNLIPAECEAITPQMLPLVDLEAEQIERIIQAVPGGVGNIQDIYPLAPLQEGILFHHLLNDQSGDAYVLPILLSLSSREKLEELIAALQEVIDRHDVLRTAVLWEQLPRPVQVVYRRAVLPVEVLVLDRNRDPTAQLKQRMSPEGQRLDVRQAPLMRLQIAADARSDQWYALLQLHHLAHDHESVDTMLAEVMAYIDGRPQDLPKPVAYRNHVAQALTHARAHDAEAFFRSKLGDIDEPTAPFGMLDVQGDGSRSGEARQALDPPLARRVRAQARRLSVSAAAMFHAAWAVVVSRTSGRDDVVYGTLLSGRLQGTAGAQRILGMFINTLPLRLRLRGITVKELVEQTQRELVELLNHEQASLAAAQRCSGIAGSAPLFSTLLNYLHSTPHPEAVQPKMASGINVLDCREWTNYPIWLVVDDQGEGFELTAQADRHIDPQRITGYMQTAIRSLVQALEHMPQSPALSLSILPEHEWHQIIELFNATQTDYPQERLVHELFERQAERTPDAVAVVYGEQTLTYAELNRRANQLARYLRDKGVGPDRLVGICVERSLEMVVGLLGILKAGGAYMPLDANYPIEQLQYMLKNGGPQILLSQEQLKIRFRDTAIEMVALDSYWNEIAAWEDGNLDPRSLQLTSRHLAYVIYTSGSTGEPKGAMNEHRGVVNRLLWMQRRYGLHYQDRVLQKTPFSFDVSVWEFFWTLMSGARLIVARPQGHQDPSYLRKLIEETGVTTLHFVPSMLQIFLDQHQAGSCKTVRHILCSGEELSPALQNKCLEYLPDACLSNLYGPTEAAVDVTAWECQLDQRGSRVPIGRPISNIRIYLLDHNGQPVPIGVAGEIYIGGVGVGRGYLSRPELTTERFVADPFSADPRARLYKTGDLGRWRSDGAIEYLGRNDHQVKIRGFRIELGGIEAQLLRHAQVKEAVVIAREDVPGEKRLVAYVTQRDQIDLSVEVLHTHLRNVLPDHMVPSAFVVLERVPLTSNGKLDRRALPVPEFDAHISHKYEAPQGEVEEILAWIWQELLRVERVGREDNFFELGGHSILAMQVKVRIRSSLSVEMPMSALFEFPTLRQLSVQVDDLRHARLLNEIAGGGDDIKELLGRVASMPEGKVQELVRELKIEGRS
jgi:amino acid adenylation domain-containing protein